MRRLVWWMRTLSKSGVISIVSSGWESCWRVASSCQCTFIQIPCMKRNAPKWALSSCFIRMLIFLIPFWKCQRYTTAEDFIQSSKGYWCWRWNAWRFKASVRVSRSLSLSSLLIVKKLYDYGLIKSKVMMRKRYLSLQRCQRYGQLSSLDKSMWRTSSYWEHIQRCLEA